MPRNIGNEGGNRVPLNKSNFLEHMFQYYAKELRPLSLHTTHIIYYAMKSEHYSLQSGFAKSSGGFSLNAQKATAYHIASSWGTRYALTTCRKCMLNCLSRHFLLAFPFKTTC